MKTKIVLFAIAALFLGSCSTYQYTSRNVKVNTQSISVTPTIVDVRVDYTKRITETSQFHKSKQDALDEAKYQAIQKNKIDILIDPIFKVEYKHFRYQASVTGFAGYYTNSRTLHDDILQYKDVTKDDIEKYLILHNPEVIKYLNQKGEVININHNGK